MDWVEHKLDRLNLNLIFSSNSKRDREKKKIIFSLPTFIRFFFFLQKKKRLYTHNQMTKNFLIFEFFFLFSSEIHVNKQSRSSYFVHTIKKGKKCSHYKCKVNDQLVRNKVLVILHKWITNIRELKKSLLIFQNSFIIVHYISNCSIKSNWCQF